VRRELSQTKAEILTQAPFLTEASYECAAIRLEIATPPETVGDCNCSICRRYGALWTYYPADKVHMTGATSV
jgi:hypothetical protein